MFGERVLGEKILVGASSTKSFCPCSSLSFHIYSKFMFICDPLQVLTCGNPTSGSCVHCMRVRRRACVTFSEKKIKNLRALCVMKNKNLFCPAEFMSSIRAFVSCSSKKKVFCDTKSADPARRGRFRTRTEPEP